MIQGIWADVMAGIILMILSGGAAYLATTRRIERKDQERLNDVESILHGPGTSNIMEGLIEIVDQHEGDIDRIMSTQDELLEEVENVKDKYKELEKRVKEIKDRCDKRHEDE